MKRSWKSVFKTEHSWCAIGALAVAVLWIGYAPVRAQTKSVFEEEIPPVEQVGTARPDRLRCWQEGLLLFEKNGWKAPEKAVLASGGIVLSPSTGSGKGLILMKIGRATCLVD